MMGRAVAASVSIALLAGCSLLEIKQQAELADSLAVVRGSVESRTTQAGVVYVVVYRRLDTGLEVVRKTVLSGEGKYLFNLEPGTYVLGTFVDASGDGVYQNGEHASYLGAESGPATPLQVGPSTHLDCETLVIHGPIVVDARIEEQRALSKSQLNTGRIASLDEPMFAPESAQRGLWRPLDFVAQYGGGLMMLQAFDPKKVPVVFVHGISGSARSFDKVIDALDDEGRFQPWVFQYPSGLRLDAVSNYLAQALDQLHAQHGFSRIMLVAHSMGGLMTRSFMMKHAERKSAYRIALGVTINSPLGGMDSAAAGVKSSPIVVPVWRDMASDGEYVERVTAWQWPRSVPYHLIFSYLPGEPGDGVIPLTSQLSLSLQEQAVAIHGFQGEHTAVLADPELVRRLAALLESHLTASSPTRE
jgi:pimeloyl-ACP methyl ester carboxylesterase